MLGRSGAGTGSTSGQTRDLTWANFGPSGAGVDQIWAEFRQAWAGLAQSRAAVRPTLCGVRREWRRTFWAKFDQMRVGSGTSSTKSWQTVTNIGAPPTNCAELGQIGVGLGFGRKAAPSGATERADKVQGRLGPARPALEFIIRLRCVKRSRRHRSSPESEVCEADPNLAEFGPILAPSLATINVDFVELGANLFKLDPDWSKPTNRRSQPPVSRTTDASSATALD